MKKLIELHDSSVEAVIIDGGVMIIKLKPLVVLHVSDAFVFDYEKTEYLEGSIEIHNYSSQHTLTNGKLLEGFLQIEDCQYPLIPCDLNVEKECLLYLSNISGSHYVSGSKAVVQVKK